MPRVIALQTRMEDIAALLEERGYKVIDMIEASRPGARVDAFLYTSYHPDIITSYNGLTETADITLGADNPDYGEHTSVVMVNVTGLRPEHAVSVMEQRLGQRRR